MAPTLPPVASITTATPSPAPADTPSTLGSASGLLNVVCSSSPATASAAPASAAVAAMGRRDCSTITSQASLPLEPPPRMAATEPASMSTVPHTRHAAHSSTSSAARAAVTMIGRALRCIAAMCG